MFAAGKTKGAVATAANYIEDVFSTYLYSGNDSTQTITNGIDLAGKGGMTWLKCRNNTFYNSLYDTVRGATNVLYSNDTLAQQTYTGVTSFNSTGFTLGSTAGNNGGGYNFASWTFRKQAKFFDIVTYTGNGAGPQVINHNLGSAPGCVIVKSASNTSVWWVWHRGNGGSTDLTGIELNSTSASTFQNAGVASDFTATTFNAGSLINVALNLNPNVNGQTYVAYLFAHNAGGFGLTGTDNVISCGSFTTVSGYSPNVELGYEPQWIMLKRTDSTGAWLVVDTMRGWQNPAGTAADDANLRPNVSDAENINDIGWPYATGFNAGYRGGAESTWIYIAIRRGPMKVPTDATKVFVPVSQNGGGTVTTNFPVDLVWDALRTVNTNKALSFDRLRGGTQLLVTSNTGSESSFGSPVSPITFDSNISVTDTYSNTSNVWAYWNFRRAPSFFDEVCYTGDGNLTQTLNMNLGVNPEFIIIKNRSSATNWSAIFPRSGGGFNGLPLNSNVGGTVAYSFSALSTTQVRVLDDPHTVSGVSIGADNTSGAKYVMYLFATCAGVSKVGSYTGNGTTQTIDCGFTGGARFVLIKRTDSTGDWYVYDTARGMTTLTDPYLRLNSTAAESATLGSVTTVSTGFAVNASILAAINTNGASYIYLSIA